jgi:hypothetical protein
MEARRVTIALSPAEMSVLQTQAEDALRPTKFHAKFLLLAGLGLVAAQQNNNSAANGLHAPGDAVAQSA